MKIKFYVIQCDSTAFTCFLVSNKQKINTYILGQRTSKILSEDSRIHKIDSNGFHIFLNELESCPTYHRSVARNIKSSDEPFVVQLVPNRKEYIDKTWGEIVRILIWEQLEIAHMMSWFSTLGGAFSALGDYFEDRADIAGKISIQQMKLALRIGDPSIISQCLLYLSISLIQKHKFRMAQKIVRSQYGFATKTGDKRLTKMCLGIWSKLQWTHKTTRCNKRL